MSERGDACLSATCGFCAGESARLRAELAETEECLGLANQTNASAMAENAMLRDAQRMNGDMIKTLLVRGEDQADEIVKLRTRMEQQRETIATQAEIINRLEAEAPAMRAALRAENSERVRRAVEAARLALDGAEKEAAEAAAKR